MSAPQEEPRPPIQYIFDAAGNIIGKATTRPNEDYEPRSEEPWIVKAIVTVITQGNDN